MWRNTGKHQLGSLPFKSKERGSFRHTVMAFIGGYESLRANARALGARVVKGSRCGSLNEPCSRACLHTVCRVWGLNTRLITLEPSHSAPIKPMVTARELNCMAGLK